MPLVLWDMRYCVQSIEPVLYFIMLNETARSKDAENAMHHGMSLFTMVALSAPSMHCHLVIKNNGLYFMVTTFIVNSAIQPIKNQFHLLVENGVI